MSLDMDHQDFAVILAFLYGEYQFVIDTPERLRKPLSANDDVDKKGNGSINVALFPDAHKVESLFRLYKFARMLEIENLQRLIVEHIPYCV